ncbi:Anti-sigma regulatory factor (Ser/Thr protein kinase) [Streptomyces sp. DvalAA-14]|nr:Anti-sigma regulatory factor (Ser/Thr protein kinase) [Streptomyces sp. DvalAA-14]
MFSHRFPATRLGAQLARKLAVAQLASWSPAQDTEVSETVATVVAELAANAVTHGRVPGRDCELRLVLSDRAVRIEVSDTRTERRPPAPSDIAAPGPSAESGRGLLLVQALSGAWGVTPRSVGKTVWAEIVLPGVPARSAEARHEFGEGGRGRG